MADNDYVTHVTDSTFESEVLRSKKPTLVDFWAPWCGPCLQMGPVVKELAAEYKDSAKVTKLNVDENPESAANYGIRGIPTILLFKNGKLEETIVGLVPKERLETALKKAL
ncbi:MAG: thioredoxin [Deltaproteobacteria bacterium]|nr:thioredoxin [Deltaproteobacteria bacterium]